MKASFMAKLRQTRLMIALLVFGLSFTANAQRKLVYHSLEASYIGLNAMDLVTTYKVLHQGGVELNPIMKPFINHPQQAIAVKSIYCFTFLALNRMVAKDHPKIAMISLLSLNLGMGYVVNRNYQIYLRIRF